jgi:ADP-dependent phosphofructokinase/glucokinase
MKESTWQSLYSRQTPPRTHRVLTGFNVNLDQIIPVTRELLDSLSTRQGIPAGFRERLRRAMETCTADEMVVSDSAHYRRFAATFSGTIILGGQAGISSLHLGKMKGASVTCISPGMGQTVRTLLQDAGVKTPQIPGTEKDPPHLVFEFAPGLVPLARGAIPRNNRFIVSPVHDPGTVVLDQTAFAAYLKTAAVSDRAFLSGYQYLRSDDAFEQAADQIRAAKRQNPRLKIHVEWVSGAESRTAQQLIRYILPEADSLGMNEQEFTSLFRCTGPVRKGIPPETSPTPAGLAGMALLFCRKTGLNRLHLHTYGYYLLICRNPRHPEESRQALVIASRNVIRKKGITKPGFISEGRRAVDDVTQAFGPEQSPGIFSAGNYRIIVVPSLIDEGMRVTAGTGDRISSLAFVADPF